MNAISQSEQISSYQTKEDHRKLKKSTRLLFRLIVKQWSLFDQSDSEKSCSSYKMAESFTEARTTFVSLFGLHK